MKITVSTISPSNDSLLFVDKRIADDGYRGLWSSQHNRFTMNDIEKILLLFNQYAPNGSKMTIRNTDNKKRQNNTPEEVQYARFCDKAKKITGIGTQDAMRKNLFVDFHRMGFINRYNRNGEEIAPLKRSNNIRFVSLSKQGLKFITSKNIDDKYFIFSKGVDKLLGGFINHLLEIFRETKYGIKDISIYEFMFFVSAIHSNTIFSINTQECVDLIKAYRRLTPIQRKSVIEILKVQLIPENFEGSKTDKRDFGNWKNKICQIFTLLEQTFYFEQKDEKLFFKIKGEDSKTSEAIKLYRSLAEKLKYFKNHKVKNVAGFELHHVVPLSWSEDAYQFKTLDNWQNMVYIDGYSHAKITQNNNRNVVMEKDETTILLSDYNGNTIELKIEDNIVYSLTKIVDMLSYNKQLLEVY